MTLSELIDNLETLRETYGDELVIVMSSDAEGNSFSPLSTLRNYIYVPETTWSGEIHLVELTDPLRKQGFTEEDLYDGEDGQHAVVLWPVN